MRKFFESNEDRAAAAGPGPAAGGEASTDAVGPMVREWLDRVPRHALAHDFKASIDQFARQVFEAGRKAGILSAAPAVDALNAEHAHREGYERGYKEAQSSGVAVDELDDIVTGAQHAARVETIRALFEALDAE